MNEINKPDGTIPVDDYARIMEISVVEAINQIKDGSLAGRVHDGEYFVDDPGYIGSSKPSTKGTQRNRSPSTEENAKSNGTPTEEAELSEGPPEEEANTSEVPPRDTGWSYSIPPNEETANPKETPKMEEEQFSKGLIHKLTDYGVVRATSKLFIALGLLICGLGIIILALGFLGVLFGDLTVLVILGVIGLSLMFTSILLVALGQFINTSVDNAENTRNILNLLRSRN